MYIIPGRREINKLTYPKLNLMMILQIYDLSTPKLGHTEETLTDTEDSL